MQQAGKPTAPLNSAAPTNWDDPNAVIASVQQRVLRGMLGAIAGYAIIQLLLWHTRPVASRPLVSFVFEAILIIGLAAQYLGRNRLSIRQNGILFISWLGLIDLLIWVTTGPEMSSAIALVSTVLVALFFLNKRAGAAVVLLFGAFTLLHALLVHRGLLPPYGATGGRSPGLGSLLRTGLYATGVLATGYVIFALIHHVLFEALARMTQERHRRDLAEMAQRQAEERMLANQHFEALGKLTSGVAHDVNNALTAVLGNAELLKQSLPPGEEQTFAQDILQAAQAAARTTRQLLNLNRQAVSQPESTDPVAVITTVSRLVSRLMPVKIKLVLDCQSRGSILVDPADLQQALLNLLLNARDALAAGGEITLRSSDGADQRVTLSVSDNGPGIPPAVLPRIFEPFFTTKATGQGTGLGLAMVRTFVEEAGGKVSARNLPAGGACFELTFPPCSNAPEAARRRERPEVRNQRILLVEEDPVLRALLERVVRRGGQQVTALASAPEAMEAIRAAEPFALLCCNLLADTGQLVALITAFRGRDPQAPVLLCSGHTDPKLAFAGQPMPARIELMRKPFAGTELLVRLQHMLTASRPPGAD